MSRGADEVRCVCGHPGTEHEIDWNWCTHAPGHCGCTGYRVGTYWSRIPEILTGEESGWGGTRAMDVVNGRESDHDPRRWAS